MVEMIEGCIIGQMFPILSFGEQFPTSIRMTRGCLTAQHCHRAQATRSIHVLLPLFLLIAAYFLFLRRSHYDYEAELIFIPEERFDSVASSNRVSSTTGAISEAAVRRASPYIYGRWDCFYDDQIFRRGFMGVQAMMATILQNQWNGAACIRCLHQIMKRSLSRQTFAIGANSSLADDFSSSQT
ncbi:hypothetical protein [Bradyrhizobium sp. S3.12.5]|uniref:hypothetical protein n=1 Tax=Bradyrhizobium sp. S3.12.5 TaxID=3156386 RepID=UPI003396B9F3